MSTVLADVEKVLRADGDDARERALELIITETAPESVAAKAIRLHKLIADYAYHHMSGDVERRKLSEIETLAFEFRVAMLNTRAPA